MPESFFKDKKNEFEKKFPQNFITYVNDGRPMRFAFAGDPNKTPLLFVHGSPGSWQGWSEYLMDSNLQKDFHVIAVDRPGYGGSGPGEVETSLQKQGADIIAALQFNHSGKQALLVGHSLGGPLIVRMAMDYPQQVAGLLILAGSVDPALEKIKWFQYPANWKIFRWLIPENLLVCNDEIMPLKAELEKMDSLWPRVRAKVAIIHGTKDDLVPIENLNYLLKNLKSEQVIDVKRVEGLNHFIPWKRSDLVFSDIFLLRDQIN